jgi:hypothetical protein
LLSDTLRVRPTKTGAGEGNRTLVISLEGFSSTIELHPQGTSTSAAKLNHLHTQHWWRGLDSNQRTRKRADLQSAAINHSATPPQGTPNYSREPLPCQPLKQFGEMILRIWREKCRWKVNRRCLRGRLGCRFRNGSRAPPPENRRVWACNQAIRRRAHGETRDAIATPSRNAPYGAGSPRPCCRYRNRPRP